MLHPSWTASLPIQQASMQVIILAFLILIVYHLSPQPTPNHNETPVRWYSSIMQREHRNVIEGACLLCRTCVSSSVDLILKHELCIGSSLQSGLHGSMCLAVGWGVNVFLEVRRSWQSLRVKIDGKWRTALQLWQQCRAAYAVSGPATSPSNKHTS